MAIAVGCPYGAIKGQRSSHAPSCSASVAPLNAPASTPIIVMPI